MHTFWQPAFLHLHEAVVDYLGQPAVHDVLPLLRLNRHFRQLAIERLFKSLVRAEDIPETGDLLHGAKLAPGLGFVRVHIAQGPSKSDLVSLYADDPRYLFEDGPGFNRETDIWWIMLDLYLTKIDPATLLCTFEPLAAEDLHFTLTVDPDFGRAKCDKRHKGHQPFQLASSLWFRPALDGKNSHLGMQLAAPPDRQPSGIPAFWALCADDDDPGCARERNCVCELGWIVDYLTQRGGGDKWSYDEPWVEAYIEIYSVQVPLVDLFAPPRTAKDDLAFARKGGLTLEEYLQEYERKNEVEREKEMELAVYLDELLRRGLEEEEA